MKQMNWHTFQTQFPDKAANYSGGEQAFNQQQQIAHDNWAYPGGIGKPQGGGGQHPLIALGLAGYQGGQTNPQIQNPHQGGQNPFIQTVQGGRERFPPGLNWPPRGWPPKPKQAPWEEFGEQLGGYEEQLGGFGETLGGYGEQIGGFGEQMSGVEEAMGGFGEQF